MKIEIDKKFQDALNIWLNKCQSVIENYYKTHFKNLTPSTLVLEEGNRYVRVVSIEGGANRSAWAFIDKTNGDILKPASWKSPAKWARGNILDDKNGMGSMGPYGPAYLK
jgi:hypothetical protein